MTDLSRVERTASLRHQVGLEPSDSPAGLPGPDLTQLLGLLSHRADGNSLAAHRALPHLEPEWSTLIGPDQ